MKALGQVYLILIATTCSIIMSMAFVKALRYLYIQVIIALVHNKTCILNNTDGMVPNKSQEIDMTWSNCDICDPSMNNLTQIKQDQAQFVVPFMLCSARFIIEVSTQLVMGLTKPYRCDKVFFFSLCGVSHKPSRSC